MTGITFNFKISGKLARHSDECFFYLEIAENVDAAEIILKPFHTAIINQKIYARKLGNAGSFLPFQKLCENPIPLLSVRETPSHYLVNVSKDSLRNQNKFLIQFEDKT